MYVLTHHAATYLQDANSIRIRKLARVKSQHKFLLTGTPVQNNLSELLTLVSFLNPALFSKYQSSESDHQLVDHFDYELKRNLEKKGLPMDDDHRLAAARTVLLPFVLRRVKADVDTGLLEKQILVEECALGATHRAAYAEVEAWLAEAEAATKQAAAERLERGRKKPGSSKVKAKAKQQAELPASSLNNRDMQLRKAANHPLLHRRLFDSVKLSQVASVLLSAAEASAVAAASAAAAAAVAAAERACTMPKLTKGLRIQVLWADPDGGEEGGTWFTGTVSAAPKSGKAAVEYDDGEKAVLVLAEEEYRVLAPVGGDGEDDAAASTGSAAGACAGNGDGDVDVDVDGDGNGGEGEDEDDEGAIPWQTSGHSCIGCLALRHCEDDDGTQRKQEGRITMWAPADEAEGDPALWHMVHDDGDEEDLEEEEVLAARTLFFKRREFLQKAVGIACRTLHDVVWGVRPLEPVERGAFVCEFAGQIQLRCVPFRGKGKRWGGGGRVVPQCARRSVFLRGCG